MLAIALYSAGQFQPSVQTARRVVMITLGSLVMGAALFAALWLVGPELMNGSLLVRLLLMTMVIAGGAVVYFGLALATGAMDRQQLAAALRRRGRSGD